MSSLQQAASKATVNSVGGAGSKAITGTSAVTPPTGYYFFAIQAISDTTVSAQVDVTDALNADLSAVGAIPGGAAVYGKWTSVTLSGGAAIGYLAKVM